jgi:sugar phosphate isomerase/epimerase
MDLLIGASSGVFFPMPVEEAVGELARQGYPAIEAILHTPEEYSAPFCRELQRRAEAHGSRIVSLHAHTQLHPVLARYPRRREYADRLLREICASAHEIAAPIVVWHGVPRDEVRGHSAPLDELLEVYCRLASEAAQLGVRLTLENVSWCLVRTIADISAAKAAGARFTFDPFQALEAEQDPLAVVRAMGDALAHVHASDYQPPGRHLPPGDGTIDWPALLSEIRAVGYDGPVINEAPTNRDPTSLARGASVLQNALT